VAGTAGLLLALQVKCSNRIGFIAGVAE